LFKSRKTQKLGSSRASEADYSDDEKEIAESGLEYIETIKKIDGADPNYV